MIPTEELLKKIDAPPTFEGELHCKQINLELLDKEDHDNFLIMFASFFKEAKAHPMRDKLENLGYTFEQKYNERRFGAHGLPRGKYYTQCSPETGFSQQTLAMELLAYASELHGFVVEVIDIADPQILDFVKNLGNNIFTLCQRHNNKCLVIIKRQLKVKQGESRDIKRVVIPYKITRLHRQSILDLRDKKAMEWLFRILWEYFPGTLFTGQSLSLGSDPKDLSSVIPPSRFTGNKKDFENIINDLETEDINLRNCGLKTIFGNRMHFLTLLQLLLNPKLGGTAMDSIIGELLVSYGVDCLVYPSARHDCGVYYKDNEVVAHLGWHIVDFNSLVSTPFQLSSYIIDSPESYAGLHGQIEISLNQISWNDYKVDSWQLHGTGELTKKTNLKRAWLSILKLECSDFPISPMVKIERTPWISYNHEPKRRKPRLFDSWYDIRLAIIAKEIRLSSFMLDNNQEPSIMVGNFIVELSQNYDLWGHGVIATDFDEDDSFLVNRNFGIICPACGDIVKEISLERMTHCLCCGFHDEVVR